MSTREQTDHRAHAVPWKGYWALLTAFKEATRTFPAPQNGMEVISNDIYLATRDYTEVGSLGWTTFGSWESFLLQGGDV